MDLRNLIHIAEDLNLQDYARTLRFYADRLASADKDLILPLIGEFSSGKTTLINSLLDNPNLETASRATTASIFEIHFGAPACRAEIVSESGELESVNDVSTIKNENLKNIDVVKVYDTSKRIGSSTILVDTPGLSSNDPAHRIALSSYLPNADAILLLTDVNQQLTRSLIDFLNASKLVNKPVYAVITKCDTKTQDEVAQAKAYIQQTIEFPFAGIITVSATKGEMSEFDALIDEIQLHKNEIVERAVNERVRDIAKKMANVVEELLKQGNSTDEIDDALAEEQKKLDRISRNIDLLIRDAGACIEDKSEQAVSRFSKTVFAQIDHIVKNQGRDCDAAVYSAVNSTGIMVLKNFQKDLLSDILSLARMRQSRMEEVPLNVLETINLSENAFNGFSYDVDLASMGHKYDKAIGIAVLATAAVATMGVAAGAAGAAGTAGAARAAATSGSVAIGTGATVATDIATDIYFYSRTKRNIEKAARIASQAGKYVGTVTGKMAEIDQKNQELGQKAGMKRGLIETSIGWVTEFFAKPARQRAVNNYIEGSLIPEFRQQILSVADGIMREIRSLLTQEAVNGCEHIRAKLQELKAALEKRKEDYSREMEQYRQYAILLNEAAK